MSQDVSNNSSRVLISESRLEAACSDRRFKMRRRVDAALGFIRSCAGCGWTGSRIELFCERCDEALEACQNRGESLSQAGYPFAVSSLFTWGPRTDGVVRPMVYSLKGGWQVQALTGFARRISFEKTSKHQGENLLFVPPPPRAGKSRYDHAWVFAHCLAGEWGGQVWSGLNRSQVSQTQKNQSRQERARLRFGSGEAIEDLSAFDRIIFVDDVITTGSTAMAAYMALGDPDAFEVWTLVNRPNLAGPEGI